MMSVTNSWDGFQTGVFGGLVTVTVKTEELE